MSANRPTGHPVTATVLITDPNDRVLIVRSARGGTWHLTGVRAGSLRY